MNAVKPSETVKQVSKAVKQLNKAVEPSLMIKVKMSRVYSIEFLLKLRPRAMLHPFRQPLNPPEATLIQKHAGFARFLKQHASPPHHRVTAGGRIVPAGPLSPPPFQLLPSINAVISNPHVKGSSNDKSSSRAVPLAQQNVNANRPHVGTAQTTQTQAPPLFNQFGTNLGPLPAGAAPIGFLLDGSPIVYYEGVSYQSFFNGTSTILKPLQFSIPHMGYNAPAFSQPAFGPHFYGSNGFPGTGYPLDNLGSMQFTDGISDAQEQPLQADDASSHNTVSLHQHLNSQLTTLDRYVALHLHEFSPAENARCTAMRRQLIEQLDSLRMSKASTSSLNFTNGKMQGVSAAAPWPARNGTTEAPYSSYGVSTNTKTGAFYPTTPVTPGYGINQDYSSGINGRPIPSLKSRKCLSPDAPPFVPGSTAALTHGTDNIQHTKPVGVQKLESPDSYKMKKPLPQQAEVGLRKLNTDLDSSDGAEAATPHVSMSEIEYASTPGFNPPVGPKVYCTTASEFQEVIRRVRQQAQMYGCKGGQSKDPAYDAEQDVRWAMADGEPIPLPQSPADHLTQPRPWNWDDSAFNCRPQATTSSAWAKGTRVHGVLRQPSGSTGSVNPSSPESWVTNSWEQSGSIRSTLYGAKDVVNLGNSNAELKFPTSKKDDQASTYRQDGQQSNSPKQMSGEEPNRSKLGEGQYDALSFDSQGVPYLEDYDAGNWYDNLLRCIGSDSSLMN